MQVAHEQAAASLGIADRESLGWNRPERDVSSGLVVARRRSVKYG
jgi:hypothetical protein